MFKKILWISLGLLVCITTLVMWFVVHSLNATTIQTQFINAVQEATGRTVTIAGEPQLVWRPIPTLTLTNVGVSNIEGSKVPDMLTVDEIQIQMDHPARPSFGVGAQRSLFLSRGCSGA